MNNEKRLSAAKTIDWKEVHQRIQSTQQKLERNWQPSDEEKKKALEERAKLLARLPVQTRDDDVDLREIVTFTLAYETYAIEALYVGEVYPLIDIVPVPCTPAYFLGIINVRGQIISVIDIRKFFDIPNKGITDLNRVIILRDKTMEFGILADSITGVRTISLKSLQKGLPTLTGIREEYLLGVTGEPLVVLDAKKLLSDRSIVVNDNVETQ